MGNNLTPYSSCSGPIMVSPATSQILLEKYDVFISFRGSDIRHTFLSHLTNQLRREGINVYVDERLERGTEISTSLMKAIERSTIALVIFTKDYASSEWCLEELVKIMECKGANNQIVIPVFYNIDPSHVRNQKGTYVDAFVQHKKKFKDDVLQAWRIVLKETANLSGYHHSSNVHDDSDLIDKIIKFISEKLEDEDIIISKHLIGFEENLDPIESFMKVDSQEVGVLGIWGPGGIGKTTLARAVFDKFAHQFGSSYFVSNVREESKKLGLDCLLEKIFSALLSDRSHTTRGRPNAGRRLHGLRILLVLDDVDSSIQLKYFVEEHLLLGPGSKIIVTSRDKHVLISGGVHEVHEIKVLNMEDSRQLFYRHAFKQAYPKMGYENLSEEAIQYAGCFPLALKVLGSFFYSKTIKAWEKALKKMRKYPNMEIQDVLKLSYDGLDMPEQRLFLDIAFFFRGEKEEDISRVVDACDDLYEHSGIDSLIDKALITISRDNRVEIHDLLQQMAENIVREESREHPGRRSRLNDVTEIQDVLENDNGTDAIEGIIFELKESETDLFWKSDAFKKMSKLRILNIQCICPTELFDVFDSHSHELRYFRWEGYPLKSLPQGFSPKKLVEIHMPWSQVEKLWDGVQDLMNLKVLDISFSFLLLELPDFSKAQKLEIMDLSQCVNLCSIHPSILSLPKLASLDLNFCFKLENLHGNDHLKSLKHLTLSGCESLKDFLVSSEEMTSLDLTSTGIETLKLPVGRFNKLEELYLSSPLKSFQTNELSCLTSLKQFRLLNFRKGITEKPKLHILFDAWRLLVELHLVDCEVTEIPENISGLPLLEVLVLRGCRMESLPNCIKHLTKLTLIDLGHCDCLKSLPELPPSITHFDVDHCTSLETINFRSTLVDESSSWGLARCDMTEFINLKLMEAIYNNTSCKVRFCYSGSTFPKGFKYYKMGQSSISIELAPSSSSDHLLGFASCCILSPPRLNYSEDIYRKFLFEDKEIDYEDGRESEFIKIGKTDHVIVWYDPLEHILKAIRRRRFVEGTNYKFAYEFGERLYIKDENGDQSIIKGCGIWPVYASQLQVIVQQTETEVLQSLSLFESNTQ